MYGDPVSPFLFPLPSPLRLPIFNSPPPAPYRLSLPALPLWHLNPARVIIVSLMLRPSYSDSSPFPFPSSSPIGPVLLPLEPDLPASSYG